MNRLTNRRGSRSGSVTRHRQVPTSSDDDSSTICAICCEDTSAASEVARPTVCSHIFCRQCLERLCRTSRSSELLCPLDRKPFDRIAVRRPDAGSTVVNEVILDAATLAPLQGIFESPRTPVILGCILLSVLCAVPSWLLALHSLAVVIIYCVTKGTADFGPYTAYAFVFYCALVPASFIGLIFTTYTWGVCVLMIYCAHGIPALTSSSLTPEKLLHVITATLVCLIYPMTLFSIYTMVQASCYVTCLLAGIALCSKLFELYGTKFARTGLLFFSLVFAPYVCQLQHLSFLHMTYTCLLLLASLFVATWETQLHPEVAHLPANVALNFAISAVLGLSPWISLYVLVALVYASIVYGQWKAGRLRQVPLLLGINAAVVGCLLPWKLFGLMSYLSCMVIILVFCSLIGRLLEFIRSLPNSQVIYLFYNAVILGMLVPSFLLGQ